MAQFFVKGNFNPLYLEKIYIIQTFHSIKGGGCRGTKYFNRFETNCVSFVVKT